MSTRMTALLFVFIMVVTGNVFGANPADLTVFERFVGWSPYIKGIWEQDGITAFAALPAIDDFGISVQAWQSQDSDSQKFIGRFIRGLTPNIDVALLSEFASKKGVSDINNRVLLDLHGELFGLPAGIGFSVPLDEKESFKVGPRIGVADFTFFATAADEGKYVLGTTFSRAGYKLEVAYDTGDIWYAKLGKGFKTSIGKVCPEFRAKFLPNEQVYGFGVGLFF